MRRKLMRLSGFVVSIMGLLYIKITTAHFGYNFFPQSPAECITDGIGLALVAAGIITYACAHDEP